VLHEGHSFSLVIAISRPSGAGSGSAWPASVSASTRELSAFHGTRPSNGAPYSPSALRAPLHSDARQQHLGRTVAENNRRWRFGIVSASSRQAWFR